MSDQQVEDFDEWADANQAKALPIVVLPSADVTISQCAKELFGLIAPTKQLFVRGAVPVILCRRDDGMRVLEILRPASARSFFEKFGRLFAWRVGADGLAVQKPVNCAHDMADALLQSSEAADLLPRVDGLINCPIIREIGGQLQVAGPGYDPHTRLLVTGGEIPSDVPLAEAVAALLGLFDEFDFQSPGDKSRVLASLLSPAFALGGLLQRRVPADVAEADQSQSGKTFRQKLNAAIYNERLSLVSMREGGVGSVDESLNHALVAGRPFVQFDNFRGRFQSAHSEAFMTAEGSFSCRVPYRGEISVRPESFFLMLSSNGVDTTRDFANRSILIRIKKQPPGFVYRQFPEGDLLDHVRARQAHYLGCVFSVVRGWHARGKLRSKETGHDFREWVQVLDWIVQNIMGLAPVMEGHLQAQEAVSNPALVWLRQMVLAINRAGRVNQPLTATNLLDICESENITIPGLRPGADEASGKKVIGSILARLFGDQETIEVGSSLVTRAERNVPRADPSQGGAMKSNTITVTQK